MAPPQPLAPSPQPRVLFVGGGSGGHIFPNLAVAERLDARYEAPRPVTSDDEARQVAALRKNHGIGPHFLVSDRAIDATIMEPTGYPWTAAPAKPLYRKPGLLVAFLKGYLATKLLAKKLIREQNIRAVVATGGFVTLPAVVVARKLGVPVALINLDAVPGKANLAAARHATKIFSVYDTPQLPAADRIGLPLRLNALTDQTPAMAREAFGLVSDRPTILVFAGSQGGSSINQTMIAWAKSDAEHPKCDIQVLHFTGPVDAAAVAAAYAAANIPHYVAPFCDRMGLAWAAADLAVCRAGAGSVAEAWANAVPAIFLPYPYHKDQHQRRNAQTLVDAGGAIMIDDRVEAEKNLKTLGTHLAALTNDPVALSGMCDALRASRPSDGARVVADWLIHQLAAEESVISPIKR